MRGISWITVELLACPVGPCSMDWFVGKVHIYLFTYLFLFIYFHIIVIYLLFIYLLFIYLFIIYLLFIYLLFIYLLYIYYLFICSLFIYLFIYLLFVCLFIASPVAQNVASSTKTVIVELERIWKMAVVFYISIISWNFSGSYWARLQKAYLGWLLFLKGFQSEASRIRVRSVTAHLPRSVAS
jgi:hypothetical protein